MLLRLNLGDASGRLWSTVHEEGLLTCVLPPSPSKFSVVAYDNNANTLAAITEGGSVYLLHVGKENRYVLVDHTGYSGTAAAFSSRQSSLFVGYAVRLLQTPALLRLSCRELPHGAFAPSADAWRRSRSCALKC